MSKTYQNMSKEDGAPRFKKPMGDILAEVKPGGAIKIVDPLEYHTDQQRKWYKGICLRGLSDWNGETKDEWDLRLKDECNGIELLKKETILLPNRETCERLTIKGVGKRNLTAYIENILSYAITNNLPVTPPDPDLRK